jgi:hypothetical protein
MIMLLSCGDVAFEVDAVKGVGYLALAGAFAVVERRSPLQLPG